MEIHLTELEWPEWGMPEERPVVAREELERRLEAARVTMRRLQLSHLLVYGDREHCANLLYLSGYDPRFEEALLLLGREGPPRLLVGNEGLGYTGISPLPLEVELFQPFSLIGQDPRAGGHFRTSSAAPVWRPGSARAPSAGSTSCFRTARSSGPGWSCRPT